MPSPALESPTLLNDLQSDTQVCSILEVYACLLTGGIWKREDHKGRGTCSKQWQYTVLLQSVIVLPFHELRVSVHDMLISRQLLIRLTWGCSSPGPCIPPTFLQARQRIASAVWSDAEVLTSLQGSGKDLIQPVLDNQLKAASPLVLPAEVQLPTHPPSPRPPPHSTLPVQSIRSELG